MMTRTKTYPFGKIQDNPGSHAPLMVETDGWCWRNPLNLLPLGILLMVVAGVLAALI